MLTGTDLEKSYGKKKILCGVSIEAKAGECIGIAGANGCGKTTLLSILAGVIKPDRGQICFDGEEAVGKSRVFARCAAFVPQENPLIPELSAYDNYRLWFRGEKKKMEESLSSGIGKRLGLCEFLKTPAGTLSGGQKKRLSIASALSGEAKVLILDEPGAALDLEAKETILSYLEEYRAQGGTVLLTSHELTELAVCTKLYILKEGHLIPASEARSAADLIRQFHAE